MSYDQERNQLHAGLHLAGETDPTLTQTHLTNTDLGTHRYRKHFDLENASHLTRVDASGMAWATEPERPQQRGTGAPKGNFGKSYEAPINYFVAAAIAKGPERQMSPLHVSRLHVPVPPSEFFSPEEQLFPWAHNRAPDLNAELRAQNLHVIANMFELHEKLNDSTVLAAAEMYGHYPECPVWSMLAPFNTDRWPEYAKSVIEFVKTDEHAARLKDEEAVVRSNKHFSTGMVAGQEQLKGVVRELKEMIEQQAVHLEQLRGVSAGPAMAEPTAPAAGATALPHPDLWWTDTTQWDNRAGRYRRTKWTVPQEKKQSLNGKISKNQRVLKMPGQNQPLPISRLLLSQFTAAEANKIPGIGGMFELMHFVWTTQAPGSEHPPFNVLLTKETTALDCLPPAETKTVKEFRKVWKFVLNQFSHIAGTDKDKLKAADLDASLKMKSLKAVYTMKCVNLDDKGGRPMST
jgi:hypothetical protein